MLALASDLLVRRRGNRHARVAGQLKVLLADAEGERARLLEQRLRELGDVMIERVDDTGNLVDAVRSVWSHHRVRSVRVRTIAFY